MCQQWLSVAGLVLDIVGFLIIAYEWREMFKREMHQRLQRIVEDYARDKADNEGTSYEDPSALDYTMWGEFQKLWQRDKRFRLRLFYTGMTMIVLGFILQAAGSWPGGIWVFKSC